MADIIKPLSFPQGLEKYNMVFLQFSARDIDRSGNMFKKSVVNDYSQKKATTIYLPLMTAIPTNLTTGWSGPQLTLGEDVSITEGLKKLATVGESSFIGKLAKKFGDVLTGSNQIDFGGRSATLSDLTASTIRATKKWNVAPTLSQLYNGPEFRTFQFDFVLIPSNEKEAEIITKIIRDFNYYSLPERTSNSKLIWPAQWDIKIVKPGKKEISSKSGNIKVDFLDALMSFETLVCTQVNVTYGSDASYYFYKDGMPNQIKLSLSFQETTYLTRDNYDKKN